MAKVAGEVAARGAEGKNRRPGKKVVEWFLFDGVDTESTRPAVGREYDFPVLTGSDKAHPALSVPKFTITGTHVALDPAILNFMPVFRIYDALHVLGPIPLT